MGARLQVTARDVRNLVVYNRGRALRPGEKVALVYGDRQEGSPGSRAQTFQEARRHFWVSVDAKGQGQFTRLPDSPSLAVVGGPGGSPSGSSSRPRWPRERPLPLLMRAEDAWGNPAGGYSGFLRICGSPDS